jgi:predicted Holliday junction resolvase-like endonuclease
VSLALVMAVLALVFTVRTYHDRVGRLQEEAEAYRQRAEEAARKHSAWRQQAPYMPNYPLDPRGLRHIGTPVSGAHFESDRVVFVEFLGEGETLSPEAARVRDDDLAGRVEWLEVTPTSRESAGPGAHAPPTGPDQAPPG